MGSLESIKKKLNRIRLKNCENVKIGDMLHYQILHREDMEYHNFTKFFKTIISWTLWRHNVFRAGGEGKILFYASESSARVDHRKHLVNVINLADDYISMMSVNSFKLHLSYIRYLSLLYSWNKQLRGYGLTLEEKRLYLAKIYMGFISFCELTDYLRRTQYKPKMIMVWCDVMSSESFLVQTLNTKGYETYTFQHGMYSSANEWLFKGSYSKYMIAANQYAIDEGIRCGARNKMILAGFCASVGNKKIKKPEKLKNYNIGILLDNEEEHEANIELINFMSFFCRNNNKKLYIKVHPTGERLIEDYKNRIDNEVFAGIWCTEISLSEFARKLDIAVIRNSSTLIDMYENWIPTFSYVSKLQNFDNYKNVEFDIRFSDKHKLLELIDGISKKGYLSELQQIRNYFYVENAEEKYKKLFEITS